MDDNLASSNAPRHGAIPSLIYRHSSMPPPSETDWDSTFGTSRRRMDGVYAKRWTGDRKSTRLNSSHRTISYSVFCLKKQNTSRSQPEQHQRLPGELGIMPDRDP